jgi:hypothetical protein
VFAKVAKVGPNHSCASSPTPEFGRGHIEQFGAALPALATSVRPIAFAIANELPTPALQFSYAGPKVVGREHGLVPALIAAPHKAVVVFIKAHLSLLMLRLRAISAPSLRATP